ncbi:hypothetical protein V500_02297 [Pseudogymnoascus sp. VKM F-4518 (FW-2643)]|nr:hypothetical protein V500_02297 [Pseudogymnoascus sp. VKM F-4518 (FW-2643)]
MVNDPTYLQRYKLEYLPTLDRTRYPSPPANTGLEAGNEIERVGKGGDVASALLQRLYHPDEALLHRLWPDLLEDYPAHLHIDILPDFQAMGGGRRLMAELMKKLNADRVRGIHLMKAGENKGAEIFYGRVGFERYPVVMDGGESGEIGRKAGGGVCMVQKSSQTVRSCLFNCIRKGAGREALGWCWAQVEFGLQSIFYRRARAADSERGYDV